MLFWMPDGSSVDASQLGGLYRNEAGENYEFRDGYKYHFRNDAEPEALHGPGWRQMVRTVSAKYTSQLPTASLSSRRPGPIDASAVWLPSVDLTGARADLDVALAKLAAGAATGAVGGVSGPAGGAVAGLLSALPVSPLVLAVLAVGAFFILRKRGRK